MQQKWNDLSKYMAVEDRSNADRFAWPGLCHDVWFNPAGEEGFQSIFGPDAKTEDKVEYDQISSVGLEMMSESLMTDELRAEVRFDNAEAPGCPEDPDAPPVPIRRVRPASWQPGEKLPVLYYCYSAGTTQYLLDCWDAETSRLCERLGRAVIVPCYRTHSENMFPDNVNDLHAAHLWLIENADEWGFDPDRVVAYGQSWGATMASALAHRLKRYGVTPVMRGIVSLAPVLDMLNVGTSSRYQWQDGGYPSLRALNMCYESYVGYGNLGIGALLPEVWPNNATAEDIKGMPPICLHLDETDVNRDAGLQYAQKHLDVGVFCGVHLWPATQHGFMMAMTLITTDDPYCKRCMEEIYADIKGFFDYDFRREF